MLYDSDVNKLMAQWEANLDNHSADYRIAVRDCIYDLRNLMDKELQDEAFEQRIIKDEKYWNDFFDNLLANGMFA